MSKFKLPLSVKIALGVVFVLAVISFVSSTYHGFTGFYNKTVDYKLEYEALKQKQVTTFDNNFLAFKEKYEIANVNKEAFIQVTNIIMSSRKDGINVAWKWMHENQQIPYTEFAEFYKDLSSFTASRYSENNAIELQKQRLVAEYNKMLVTFPNLIYNHFIKASPIEYKYGFVSEETSNKFNNNK